MKAKSKTINTPVGSFVFPMNPGFTNDLEKCQSNEDLFKLVEPRSFINPDAFTEVVNRGLYSEYQQWKELSKVNL